MTVDGCDYLVYERGAFVTNPTSASCVIDVFGPQARAAFDEQAKSDLQALLADSARHGPRLQHAFVSYTEAGEVGPDSWFGFSSDTSFVLRPSAATRASFVDSTCAEQVSPDWYRVWGC